MDEIDAINDLLEAPDPVGWVNDALVGVAHAQGYIEVDEASACVVAIEVVACCSAGESICALSDRSVVTAAHPAPLKELAPLAMRALERLDQESELGQLWREQPSHEEWTERVARLRSFLSRPTPKRPPAPIVRKSRRKATRAGVEPGDVIPITLGNESVGFGRIARVASNAIVLFIYDCSLPAGEPAPIGLRRFRFPCIGLGYEMTHGRLPQVVGRDPWSRDEEVLRMIPFFGGDYPRFYLHETGQGERPATLDEVVGLERFALFSLEGIIARIIEGERGEHASVCWPILPDRAGRWRRRPWEELDRQALIEHGSKPNVSMEQLKAMFSRGDGEPA